MAFNEFVTAVIRRAWILILCIAICVGVVGYYSYFKMTKQYESSVSVYVLQKDQMPSQNLNQDLLAGISLIKDYQELIYSRAVLEQAKNTLASNFAWAKAITLDDLSAKIKVSNKNDTHIMVISVRDTQSDHAAVIANEVSKAFVEFSKKITITSSAQIIDEALPGEKPVAPKPVVYMGLSAVIGLLIGLLAVYFHLLVSGTGASNKRRRPVQLGNAG